ncbi:YggT family protein [Brochothrix thermosphacta]|uniref:YggT family protein n=1 Tax=Brochothrix thermosphacta TaxID=2756 RepID=UPI0039B06571
MALYTIFNILITLCSVYSWALLIYILLSWIPNAQSSKFGQILGRICEPFLEPFRRFIPPIGGVLDISPILALIVLNQLIPRGLQAIFQFLSGL